MSLATKLGAPVRDPIDSGHPAPPTCADPTPLPVAVPADPGRRRRAWMVAAIIVAVGVGLAGGWLVASSMSRDVAPLLPGSDMAEPVPAAVAGTAELFTSLYLTGSSAGLEAMFVGDPPEATGVWVNRSAAVSGAIDDDGVWAVTVAVDALEPVADAFIPVGLQYFEVRISVASEQPVALAAPARVPAPQLAPSPALFREPVPPNQVSVATRFLEEYLTGGPDLARYLATPNAIQVFAEAPYVAADVRLLGTDSLGRIKAAVAATNERGVQYRLEYSLDLTFQEGIWEVVDLNPAYG